MTATLALRYLVAPVLMAAASRHRPSIDSRQARVMLLATGLQESALVETIQRNSAGKPLVNLARGFHQFEPGANQALGGILRSPQTGWLRDELARMGYPCTIEGRADLHWLLAYDQRVSVLCARALLWMDPHPLPDMEGPAWDYYLRCWRPGRPHKKTWADNWAAAVAAVDGMESMA